MNFNYSKYKGILIGITLFLLLEVSILSTNYSLSLDIAKNAEAVNIAGRQRMLSQKITKSLLDSRLSQFKQSETSLKELESSSKLFESTINAFDKGGEIIGAKNKLINITPVTTNTSIASVSEGLAIWKTYKKHIDETLLAIDRNEPYKISLLDNAIEYGRQNNLTLLKVMNDLTVDLEGVVASKSNSLKLIQTIGLALTVLSFLGIIFFALRQLMKNDVIVQEKEKENERILETVDEGLFLVDKELRVGDQQSTKMEEIFLGRDSKGKEFLEFLSDFISTKDKETTKDYFDLLFDIRKPEKLISSLNPLKEVDIQVSDGKYGFEKKSLKFSFKRVKENSEIKRILTTISDISTEVELREQLAKSEKSNEDNMNTLSIIVNSPPNLMINFIKNSQKIYKKININLKQKNTNNTNNTNLANKAQQLITIMHEVKGDASALSIDSISENAQTFESIAQGLITKPQLNGEDFLPLTVILEKMISYNETLDSLYEKIYNHQNLSNSSSPESFQDIRTNWGNLYQLSKNISKRQSKSVEFIASGLNDFPITEEFRSFINSITTQLIRNSITHGIEKESTRATLGKDKKALIRLSLSRLDNDSYELIFRDDGNGIDTKKIIEKAIDKEMITHEQAISLSEKQVISLIFQPGFSSSDTVDVDSGRGVGMALVLQETKNVGGKISIQTNKGVGTTFTIKIPKLRELSEAHPIDEFSEMIVS